MMKRYLLFVVIILFLGMASIYLFQRTVQNKTIPDVSVSHKIHNSLMDADRNFYKYSTQKGLGRAFIDFADDSVILLRQDKMPIYGKNKLEEYYLNHESDIKPLKWEPVKAGYSPDANLGYTFGKWEYAGADSSGKVSKEYGDYLTVWKKQKDGSWKYVYDGGGSTPEPITK